MKTLQLYLTRQVLQTLAMTVLVCTAVLLLANGLREVLPLLAGGKASLLGVGQAVALLIPYVLVFSLPLGLLTAMVLVFGRMSADHEYTAVRAGGVSLVALITPVVLLSFAFCCLSALVNMEVGPKCRTEFKKLLARFLLTRPDSFITENRFITEYENYVIYVGKRRGENLENILVNVKENNELVLSMRAAEGTVNEDKENSQIILRLKNAQVIILKDPDENKEPAPGGGDSKTNAVTKTNVVAVAKTNSPAAAAGKTNTTVVAGAGQPPRTNAVAGTNSVAGTNDLPAATMAKLKQEPRSFVGTIPLVIDLKKIADRLEEPKISEMSMTQLQEKKRALLAMPEAEMPAAAKRLLITPVEVQIHRQISFSFACLGFTLLGIPLGIRAHRKETAVGIVFAAVLVGVYYTFIILAQSMDTKPERYPHLIMWVPTFLFQLAGIVMIWRANRKVG